MINASLFREDLSNSDLTNADLKQANITLGKLEKIYGFNSFLKNAVLWNTDRSHAFLEAANLRGTNLRGADLTNVYPGRVDYTNTDFDSAILRNATFYCES